MLHHHSSLRFLFQIVFAALTAVTLTGWSAFPTHLMEEPPPANTVVSDIIFDLRDVLQNNEEYIKVPKKDIIEFLKAGTFSNDAQENMMLYVSARALNSKGGAIICSGYFATASGKLFRFNRINPTILEIEDSTGAKGWLMLKPDVGENEWKATLRSLFESPYKDMDDAFAFFPGWFSSGVYSYANVPETIGLILTSIPSLDLITFLGSLREIVHPDRSTALERYIYIAERSLPGRRTTITIDGHIRTSYQFTDPPIRTPPRPFSHYEYPSWQASNVPIDLIDAATTEKK